MATSYSDKVDYSTGSVYEEYKNWLEEILGSLEEQGHEVFNAVRADNYKINNADPAGAFRLDIEKLEWCDVLLAVSSEKVSAGVQTEIGYAVAKGKKVIIAHGKSTKPAWFNSAMEKAGAVSFTSLPPVI